MRSTSTTTVKNIRKILDTRKRYMCINKRQFQNRLKHFCTSNIRKLPSNINCKCQLKCNCKGQIICLVCQTYFALLNECSHSTCYNCSLIIINYIQNTNLRFYNERIKKPNKCHHYGLINGQMSKF